MTGKQLHHIIRLYDFITYYCLGESFADCLTKYQIHKEDMLKAKLSKYTLYEARRLAQEYNKAIKEIKNNFIKDKHSLNKEVINILDNVKFNIIKERFKEEILNI